MAKRKKQDNFRELPIRYFPLLLWATIICLIVNMTVALAYWIIRTE